MAFYVYVPNNEGRQDGYVSDAFETAHEAECEAALMGARARIIEAPRPSYKHLVKLRDAGWKKCATCGRATPPWRQTGQVESESAK